MTIARTSRRPLFLFAGLAALVIAAWATAQEAPQRSQGSPLQRPLAPIRAVATISILGDLVRNVGGERVEVATLIGADGDAHVYSPTPADARKLAGANAIVVNGLGLEGWMTRLVASSGTAARTIVASAGISPRRSEDTRDFALGKLDPHAWQSVANAEVYVENIRDGLSAIDPAGKAIYDANAAAYLDKLGALQKEVTAAIAKIPPERRKVIIDHDFFGYFSAAYGLAFIAPEGLSTEAEPSAKAVAEIITQIKRDKVPAVFLENIGDPRLMNAIARETGVVIGGRIFSDALSGPDGPAPTYIDLMRHNVHEFVKALNGQEGRGFDIPPRREAVSAAPPIPEAAD